MGGAILLISTKCDKIPASRFVDNPMLTVINYDEVPAPVSLMGHIIGWGTKPIIVLGKTGGDGGGYSLIINRMRSDPS